MSQETIPTHNQTAPNSISSQVNAIRVLLRRFVQSNSLLIGALVVTSLALMVGAVVLQSSLRFIDRNNVLVSHDLWLAPVVICLTLMSLYLGLSAELHVGKEIESGTLKLLMLSPVTGVAYLASVLFWHLLVFVQTLTLAIVWMLVGNWTIGLGISSDLIVAILLTPIPAAAVISLGMLIGAVGKSRRQSTIIYILIALVAIALQVAVPILDRIPVPTASTANDPFHFLRVAAANVSGVAEWISPFSQLERLVSTFVADSIVNYVAHLAIAGAQFAVLFTLACMFLKKNRSG